MQCPGSWAETRQCKIGVWAEDREEDEDGEGAGHVNGAVCGVPLRTLHFAPCTLLRTANGQRRVYPSLSVPSSPRVCASRARRNSLCFLEEGGGGSWTVLSCYRTRGEEPSSLIPLSLPPCCTLHSCTCTSPFLSTLARRTHTRTRTHSYSDPDLHSTLRLSPRPALRPLSPPLPFPCQIPFPYLLQFQFQAIVPFP